MTHRLSLYVFLLSILTCNTNLSSQDGISLNLPSAQDGYVVVTSFGTTVLVDECGGIVNSWETGNPNFHVKLLPSGNIYYLQQNTIYEQDWDGNVVVEIPILDSSLRLVYDVIKLQNGNYLSNCRRAITTAEMEALGWDISRGQSNVIDGIVELDAQGDVVWEWSIADHLIQDEYPNLTNFGIVSDHPERMDVQAVSTFDWMFGEAFMFNGFDYNQDLDQILISVRKTNEMVIIDHSTTTEEAASNEGGNAGRGGGFLYRWGNPESYGQGSEEDHYLHFQHNPNWIEHGEHAGSIIVFSNNLDIDSDSEVLIVEPTMDVNGNYVVEDSMFLPRSPERVITLPEINSDFTSGAMVMPNGNIYVTVGEEDRLIEVDESDTPVWIYELPGFQYTYRSEKYASDFPAFANRDLVSEGTVEEPPSSYECSTITSVMDLDMADVRVAVLADRLVVDMNEKMRFRVGLYDLSGTLRYQSSICSGRHAIETGGYHPGLYAVAVTVDGIIQHSRIVKIRN